MAVPHKALKAVFGREMGMGRQTFGKLGFDGLGQKLTRTVAQDFSERIGELSRLAQGDNLIVLHGVSILIWICGWLCHRHDTPPPLFRAVTNFAA
jgi:hypothetical protein